MFVDSFLRSIVYILQESKSCTRYFDSFDALEEYFGTATIRGVSLYLLDEV